MKRRLKKISTACAAAVIILLTAFQSISAQETLPAEQPFDVQEQVPEMLSEEQNVVEEFCLQFMRNSQENQNIKLKQITPMYDLYGTVTAYDISFTLDGSPAGYVIFSNFETDTPISEFSFDGGGIAEQFAENVMKEDQLAENSVTKNPARKSDSKLLYLGPSSIYI